MVRGRPQRVMRSSNGAIISSTADFQTFWKNVAMKFASNEKVIFDTSEIPHNNLGQIIMNGGILKQR